MKDNIAKEFWDEVIVPAYSAILIAVVTFWVAFEIAATLTGE